jgi:hypothetical protein
MRAARGRTTTTGTAFQATAFQAGSLAATNQSQPISPAISNPAAREAANPARGDRKDRVVPLVFVLHLSSLPLAFRLRTSATSSFSPHGRRGSGRMEGSLGYLDDDCFCQAVGGNELGPEAVHRRQVGLARVVNESQSRQVKPKGRPRADGQRALPAFLGFPHPEACQPPFELERQRVIRSMAHALQSKGRSVDANFVGSPLKGGPKKDLRIGRVEMVLGARGSATGQVPPRGHGCHPAGTTRAGRCRAFSSSSAKWNASFPDGSRPLSGRLPPSRIRGGRRGRAPVRRQPA